MSIYIREVLNLLIEGKISLEEAEEKLKSIGIKEVGKIAKLDIYRHIRAGIPEVVNAENKSPQDFAKLMIEIAKKNSAAIATRVDKEKIVALKKALPKNYQLETNQLARTAVIRSKKAKRIKTGGKIGILTAGTSDIPVAEEARVIAEEMGCEVFTAYDVGVAGLHRLFPPLEDMVKQGTDALVVVAGMEGALPSVVAGLVDIPVIGVPTSTGYGMGGKGEAALLAMLQSCSPGLAICNVDNGYMAATIAVKIANKIAKAKLAH